MTDKGNSFRAALVQLRSGRAVEPNLASAEELIRRAAAGGAQLVMTPENTALMEIERERLLANTDEETDNPALRRLSGLALELSVWLHIGATPIHAGGGKLANRSFLFAPDGAISARYDKIHMFDVDLPGGESYRESKIFQAGKEVIVARLPWGGLGLTICYDLRFPALYRELAKAGADFIAVPAAFTKQTGEAHWRILLRARAIETGTFILAAAQGGRHEVGRDTYGHSMAISPWGEVIAEAGTDPAVIFADIDPSKIAQARARIPSLQHDKPFELPHTGDSCASESSS